ncbi:MAG: glycoside hydrolase family 1 protein, partial [Chloroflexota bacterium]
MVQADSIRFPDGFLWGAATSAYQIEGAVDVDGRGQSIWDTLCRVEGAIEGGDTGRVAADHYHRYREDVALMASLGLGAYRFSVAWPRIQPTGAGPANRAGLDFYSRLVDELLGAGIAPSVTLYHWDLPQALQDAGGWPERDAALRFADYATIVFEALRDRVSHWATLNEPWCSALLGYAEGSHAPGHRDPTEATRAIHHLLLGHGLAVGAMRAIDDGPSLGIVLNLQPIRAASPSPLEAVREAIRRTDGLHNRVWTEPLLLGCYPPDVLADLDAYGGLPAQQGDLEVISQPLDWLGINYYNDDILEHRPDGTIASTPGVLDVTTADPGADATDMGWPVTPAGLR